MFREMTQNQTCQGNGFGALPRVVQSRSTTRETSMYGIPRTSSRAAMSASHRKGTILVRALWRSCPHLGVLVFLVAIRIHPPLVQDFYSDENTRCFTCMFFKCIVLYSIFFAYAFFPPFRHFYPLLRRSCPKTLDRGLASTGGKRFSQNFVH